MYNTLGSLIAVIGATTGFFLIFLIPIIVNIVYYRRKHPHNLTELQHNLVNKIESEETEIDKAIKDEMKDIDDYGISEKPKNICKEAIFFVTQGFIMLFGLFTLFIQFKSINFFNIEIKDK